MPTAVTRRLQRDQYFGRFNKKEDGGQTDETHHHAQPELAFLFSFCIHSGGIIPDKVTRFIKDWANLKDWSNLQRLACPC